LVYFFFMNTINIGCNGLIIRDNKLLMGKRKNCHGEGTYGIPGGHLEYGEKIVDAVKRELKEECGITVAALTYSSTNDQAESDQHYIQINFVINDYEGLIENTEPERCEGWEWFDLNQLPSNIFPPHVAIIEAYKQNKQFSD